jgi:hypothetical protein
MFYSIYQKQKIIAEQRVAGSYVSLAGWVGDGRPCLTCDEENYKYEE